MQIAHSNPGTSLHTEQQTTEALLDLLRQEQQKLIEADATGVMALLDEKSKVLTRAAELVAARHQALSAAGYEASETGMRAWVTAGTGNGNAAQSWARLLQLAAEAKEINRINGLLIQQHLTRNEAALQVLQGQARSDNIYGRDGQASSRTVSRSRVIG